MFQLRSHFTPLPRQFDCDLLGVLVWILMTEQQMKCRIKVILQHFPGNFFRSFFVFPMSDSKFDNIVTIFSLDTLF